jgi:hypothetical protein
MIRPAFYAKFDGVWQPDAAGLALYKDRIPHKLGPVVNSDFGALRTVDFYPEGPGGPVYRSYASKVGSSAMALPYFEIPVLLGLGFGLIALIGAGLILD